MTYGRWRFEFELQNGGNDYPLPVRILLRQNLSEAEQYKKEFAAFLAPFLPPDTAVHRWPRSAVVGLWVESERKKEELTDALFDPNNQRFLEGIVAVSAGTYEVYAAAQRKPY